MAGAGKCDFFLSRRGSVAAVAQEVTGVLTEAGYSMVVQDYGIPFTNNFVEALHKAIKGCPRPRRAAQVQGAITMLA